MTKNKIEDLIRRFNEVHLNKYDYSKALYKTNRDKILIICPLHGEFYQSATNHLKGHGCPYCSKNKKMDNVLFVKKSKTIHGDRYKYDKVEYVNNSTLIKIGCEKHGYFSQTPAKHLMGRGCPECGGSIVLNKSEFERRSRIVHGDTYDYDYVEYKNARTKIKIICKKHGVFLQKPNNHLSGYGCHICKSSIGELKILKYLVSKNIEFKKEYFIREINCYIDFYLPNRNIAIEYDGIQHFYPIKYFGGEDVFIKTKSGDEKKNNYCRENNIEMFRIPYTSVDDVEQILDSLIF